MKNCQFCSAELQPQAQFCPKCGKAASAMAQAQTQTQTAPVSTSRLRILSAICVLFCWPAAIYGFYCNSKAGNFGVSYNERSAWVSKGERGCYIGLAIIGGILLLGMLFG